MPEIQARLVLSNKTKTIIDIIIAHIEVAGLYVDFTR